MWPTFLTLVIRKVTILNIPKLPDSFNIPCHNNFLANLCRGVPQGTIMEPKMTIRLGIKYFLSDHF